MAQVNCRQCGAGFDVTPELPPVFECGNCGAEVARPVRPGPASRPAASRASPARKAAARHEDVPRKHHYRDELESAAKKDKTLVYAAIGAGVLAIGAVCFFMFGSGGAASAKDPPAAPPAVTPVTPAAPPPVTETKPAAAPEPVTAEPEPVAKTEPEPADTGSIELVRLKRASRTAKSAQEHVDAANLGKAGLEKIRKANAADAEIPELERIVKIELERALVADPDCTPAHQALGHLRYSKKEASQWAASDKTPTDLKKALEITIGEIGGDRDPMWLAGDLVSKHAGVIAEAQLLHEDRATTKLGWFYEKARKASLRMEGELGVYFSGDRNQDGFDPVVFRPYLVMVQKDPKRSSVDRAYAVIQLVRTLEETWRRRYAKEIDFSGSMSAPPIILLSSQKDYEKYITRHEVVPVFSAGHYEPSERRMVIYHSTAEDERNVIFHEGTHMLFDHKNSAKEAETQIKQSMWFSEGIAEYFGGHGPTGERDPVTGAVIYEPGRVNDTRISAIELARAVKKLIKFEELLQITREQWNRKKEDRLWSQMTYAQGWALVYYLNHAESGKYQKDFVEYMKLELNGKSGMDAFKEVFGKHGMDKIEKGYTEFLDYIIRKHKDKKIVGGKFLD